MSRAMRATARVRYGASCPSTCSPYACGPASVRDAAAAGDDYGVSDIAELARGRLARAPALRRGRRAHRSTTSTSARATAAARGVRPRPRRLLAELAREHPADRAGAARDRPRPARLRRTRRCRARRSRSPASGARSTSWRPARPRPGGRGRATRWAASPAPRWRSSSRAASSGSCCVSAAGISTTDLRREPVLAVARVLAGVTARTAALRRASGRAPAHAAPGAERGRAPPEPRCKPDIACELMQRRRLAGLRARARGAHELRLPRPAARDRLPTLIVWGAKDALVPVRDADEFERLIPERAQGGVRGHRPRRR